MLIITALLSLSGCENKKGKFIDLTLSVLAVLVGRDVVDGVAR